jgi:hypothetical protein
MQRGGEGVGLIDNTGASRNEFKYSLAYVVKGHWADEDRSYNFTTPEQLLADFWLDVDTWRTK